MLGNGQKYNNYSKKYVLYNPNSIMGHLHYSVGGVHSQVFGCVPYD